jgi:hypothetical protein
VSVEKCIDLAGCDEQFIRSIPVQIMDESDRCFRQFVLPLRPAFPVDVFFLAKEAGARQAST